jgi:hypothetical protein
VIRLIVKREGSLLSTEIDTEISEARLSMIRELLAKPELTYDEFLAKLGGPAGARRTYFPTEGGIEQYQRESR